MTKLTVYIIDHLIKVQRGKHNRVKNIISISRTLQYCQILK